MSAQGVTINGYNLQSSNIITRQILHETIAVDQAKVKIPHRDGEKLVSSTYSDRVITLNGAIVSTTASGLDGIIDEFKKNVIGAQAVNMDIDYEGGTRRFVVNVQSVGLSNRDYFNVTMVPYTLQVEAIDPPFGMDITSVSGIATNTTVSGVFTSTIVISGTANPPAIIRLVPKIIPVSATDVEFKNNTTGTSIKVSPSGGFAVNDIVEINTANFTVLKNGFPVTYTGTIPTFVPGSNNIAINTYGAGNFIDISQPDASTIGAVGQNYPLAQTFVPTATYQSNQTDILIGFNNIQPIGSLTISVYQDSGGQPGSLLGTTTIASSSVSASLAFISAIFTPALNFVSGTTYWLVATSTEDMNHYYTIGFVKTNPYPNGSLYQLIGSTYQAVTGSDMAFKVYKLTVGGSWSVGYGIQYTKYWL